MRSDEYRKALIECLLNKKADLGGRDDCAQELARFDDSAVIEALKLVACDESEDETILDSAGESLGLIWARQHEVDSTVFNALRPVARTTATQVLEELAPNLLLGLRRADQDLE